MDPQAGRDKKTAGHRQRELREQLAKVGLNLHPEKTKLIEFGRFAKENRKERGLGKPATFDFLGFTHICGRRRSDGKFAVQRKTSRKRLKRKIKETREKLLRHRHKKIAEVGRWLQAVIQGHLNYFAVPGNIWSCNQLRTELVRAWFHALRRRSQKATKLNRSRMRALIHHWIPSVKVLHPYPSFAMIRSTQDRSRMR